MGVFRDLNNEIVFVKDECVFTDSKTIAEQFGRRHDNILQLIDESIKDLQLIEYEHELTFQEMQKSININNGGRRNTKSYIMNRDAFMFLVMKMKGKKADLFKIKFIQAFNQMEKWIKDRAVGRGVRLSMTDAIKEYIPDSPRKHFKYKHFTDLVYKKVFGMNKKKLIEAFGEFENIRDVCNESQLKQIQDIESEIAVLLKYGFNYTEIKVKMFS